MAQPETTPSVKQIGGPVPYALWRRLRAVAGQEGVSMGFVIQRAVEREIERTEKEAA